MKGQIGSDSVSEDRVLILAPTGRDAAVLSRKLEEADVRTSVLGSAEEFCAALEAGAGAAIVAEEALSPDAVKQLTATLARQPAWSDFPIIVMTSSGDTADASLRIIDALTAAARPMLLERPVRTVTLISAVRVALQARRRQYELRDYLQQREWIEQRLRRQADQLRRLANQLTETESRAREEFSRLLHDHLQQVIVAAKVRLSRAQRRASDTGLVEQLADVDKLLDETIRASRSLAIDLSPPVLHHAELPEALQWLARWFREKHHLNVEVVTRRPFLQLPHNLKILLFQAVRELVFNVVKHAGVDSAWVSLEQTAPSEVCVTIEDCGRGFDPNSLNYYPAEATGFGLLSVRERLEALGGRLELASAADQGTRISLYVPLHVP